jgi:hypothetical protein
MIEARKYLVAGVVVEAVKSEGGGFYDVLIPATGQRERYVAKVFEEIAKPYTPPKEKKTW